MNKSSFWLRESYTPFDQRAHQMSRVLVRKKTRFQNAIVADSPTFGRCLILDGELQSAESDEFIYHEALVHPAMAIHSKPRTILILGGGEGATAREILRHPGVRRVTMVDIDGQVVEFCRTYLRRWHHGALSHPKLRLVIEDARIFVENTAETFDVIVSDLPTPGSEKEPIAALYTPAFYRRLWARLAPGGILVVQSGPGPWQGRAFQSLIARRLTRHSRQVRSYFVHVPSFDEPWSFVMASGGRDPVSVTGAQVDRRLGRLGKSLRFYDGVTHEHLFRIPKHMRSL